MRFYQYGFQALALGAALAMPSFASAQYAFKTIDLGNGLNTNVAGNSEHAIAGGFDDSDGNTHGFVMTKKGVTQIDAPFPGTFYTSCNFINDKGQVTGIYIDANSFHGYIMSKGSFTSIDVAGAMGTQAVGVNNRGQAVGGWLESRTPLRVHALVWDNGALSFFDVPGMPYTFAEGINDRGEISGFYRDPTLLKHGFLRSPSGSLQTIDHPLGALGTVGETVNNKGSYVGFYIDASGVDHGFLYHYGKFTTIDVPGAAWTDVYTINDEGVIGGAYGDASGATHGFVGTPLHDD